MINRLCIIGTGLIGGSLALALKKSGYCSHIVGAGRNEKHLKKAVQLGVIDSYETDYATAVRDADIVVVAVPLGSMQEVFEQIKPYLSPRTLVTDAGSAKISVINAARHVFTDVNKFIPGHPIAGIEKSGVESAFDSLFQNRKVILTPLEENEENDIEIIKAMWQATGAEVDLMAADHHDLILAGTSHLPHVLAFALVDCLNNVDDVDEIFRFAAGGFRDFTRIASSDPVMWRDICLGNSSAILTMMEKYQEEICILKDAIRLEDSNALLDIFTRAKQARDRFSM
ncbi:MAG: prephenate dehydrogenase/arogenate dehydrogenase family protein [Gammaproteobacteria bacterium]|nr:prephenate dehydrogenase/arogenate dehydrogenase family protein [Gammaproteobacteria bacterium]MDH5736495.1 prephenate dehydrogenase/arogenate dehydrogenase family protein [Gammaproteobacteria bacterium]